MPAVLVTATRYGLGLSNDLRREPVPGIASEDDEPDMDLFPDVADLPAIADVPLPRPRAKLEIPDVPIDEVCETLTTAAQSHKLPVPFFIRLIWQESRFDPRAVSPVGAQGVAQFMPATAAAMGLENPFDPLEALQYSARLLRELLGQFGNLGLAAAAYNAGPKRIFDWLAKRGKLPEETRNYVRIITGHPAERWRVTRPGRLALAVPKLAPCQRIQDVAHVVEVPAPPPLPRKRAPSRIASGPAKGKATEVDKKNKTAEVGKKNKTAEVGKKNKTAEVGKKNKAAEVGKKNKAAEVGKKAPAQISASRKRRKAAAKGGV